MAQVFIVDELKDNPRAKLLTKDFRRYKQGLPVEYMSMGKDVPFHRPSSAVFAQLQHVHILPLNSYGKTSDEFLVYTQGFDNPDCYLILAIFTPNAHELSENSLLMGKLADIAENFRSQF